MLNISGLDNGIVLDHIPAGMSMEIYKYLNLGKLDSQVAIIKNASSKKMGKKDIIKIAGGLDSIDLDVIGFLNHKITVNIITNGKISEKKTLHLPKKLTNVIHYIHTDSLLSKNSMFFSSNINMRDLREKFFHI